MILLIIFLLKKIKSLYNFSKTFIYEKLKENIKITINNENIEIENIDNYYIESLMYKTLSFKRKLEDFELNDFLRMDKYDTDIKKN